MPNVFNFGTILSYRNQYLPQKQVGKEFRNDLSVDLTENTQTHTLLTEIIGTLLDPLIYGDNILKIYCRN